MLFVNLDGEGYLRSISTVDNGDPSIESIEDCDLSGLRMQAYQYVDGALRFDPERYEALVEAQRRRDAEAERQARMAQSERGAASIAFVKLAEMGELDDATAGEYPYLFSPWAADVDYAAGQIREYGGKLYRCNQAHTAQGDWTPEATGVLWSQIADPAEAWPEWSQPVGAHDAYGAGDKVRHRGERWVSAVDANVWEPGVYGWEAWRDNADG